MRELRRRRVHTKTSGVGSTLTIPKSAVGHTAR